MKLELTADSAYETEGTGIGAGEGALEWYEKLCSYKIEAGMRCLDIGCGTCTLARDIARRGAFCYGVDIVKTSIDVFSTACSAVGVDREELTEFVSFMRRDVSHDPLLIKENEIDVAFCTETIEHLSNPYYMVVNVKNALKHGGYFCIAYPRPEDNLGYACDEHAHVYPGFLVRDSFERFMKQLYFGLHAYQVNGSSAWYVYRNYKSGELVDPFKVISGNYDEDRLYGFLKDWGKG